MLHPSNPSLIYDPVLSEFVNIRSARGLRLYEIYRSIARNRNAPRGHKREASRNSKGSTSKRR